jgi:AraC family transcriptional regulator
MKMIIIEELFYCTRGEMMDYQNVISAAINYIENNLFDKELAAEIYKAVHVSKFHFHRMFYLVTKLTVGQYIKRRRFTEISKLLIATDETLLNIAVDAGYNSHEAFTRAFKEYFGQTPSQFRKSPDKPTFLLVEPFTDEVIDFSFNQIKEPEIIIQDSITLYGVKGYSTLDASSIDRLWNQFRHETKQLKTGAGYAVWLDSELSVKDLKDFKDYSCFVGVESELPLDHMCIPKGTYAKFTVEQDFSKIYLIYAYIYFEWFKKVDYEFNNDMILEYYDEKFDYVKQTGTMSIFVPVQKKQ